MELNYNNYFTILDMRRRGYNLESDGVLDISHFDMPSQAQDDFMDNTLRIIYNLFVEYRGREWADDFFEDMAHDEEELEGRALDFKQRLHRALIEQAIFIYDHGDSQATASYEDRQYRSPYAPKAMAELWDILNF